MLDTIKGYDSVIRSLSGNIRTLIIYPEVFTAEEHAYLHPIYDRALFGALSLLDLVVGLKYLHVSGGLNNELEANYFARVVAHGLYETIRHQNKFAGKDVLELIEERLGTQASSELKSNTRKLNEVRKQHLNYLKDIRNNLFGHKLASGIEQARKIHAVDGVKIYRIANELVAHQTQILVSYVNLMQEI